MLVLSRNIGETVKIGHNIEVTILGVNNRNQIRVGINAPREIEVHREEIYERIQRNEPHRKTA